MATLWSDELSSWAYSPLLLEDDKSAATEACVDRSRVGRIFENLQAHRRMASDEIVVVERVHERSLDAGKPAKARTIGSRTSGPVIAALKGLREANCGRASRVSGEAKDRAKDGFGRANDQARDEVEINTHLSTQEGQKE